MKVVLDWGSFDGRMVVVEVVIVAAVRRRVCIDIVIWVRFETGISDCA
jgi:hypothetical protein